MLKTTKKAKSVLAQNIIQGRKKLGLSAEKFAEKIGIPYPTLRGIENDESGGRRETLDAIAAGLQCTFADLYKTPQERTEASHVHEGTTEYGSLTEDEKIFLEAFRAASAVRKSAAMYNLTDEDYYLAEFERLATRGSPAAKVEADHVRNHLASQSS